MGIFEKSAGPPGYRESIVVPPLTIVIICYAQGIKKVHKSTMQHDESTLLFIFSVSGRWLISHLHLSLIHI